MKWQDKITCHKQAEEIERKQKSAGAAGGTSFDAAARRKIVILCETFIQSLRKLFQVRMSSIQRCTFVQRNVNGQPGSNAA